MGSSARFTTQPVERYGRTAMKNVDMKVEGNVFVPERDEKAGLNVYRKK
jgi:hypothetical protein